MGAGSLSPAVITRAAQQAMDGGIRLGAFGDPAAGEPPKRGHGPMHAALAVMGAGQVADGMTTAAALQRAGTAEANPLYGADPSLARVLATKAAIMVPSGYALDRLYEHHPKTAMITALSLGAFGMGLAARNAQQGRK